MKDKAKFNEWQREHRAKKNPPKPLKADRKDFASKTRWNQDNREHRAKQYIKSKYGITHEQYLELLAQQNYACALNPAHVEPESYKLKTGRRGGFWHIDHDHQTGKVRGILCRTCNTALGALGDSLPGIALAVGYLNKHYGATETVDEHY